MSFSFQVRAADKDALREAISVELDKVVAAQPVHAADKPLVAVVAGAYLDLIGYDESQDLVAHVNGSITVTDGKGVSQANVGVSVYYMPRETT